MKRQKSGKKRKNGQVKSNLIKPLWIVVGSLWGLLFFIFLFISIGWLGYMPSFSDLENPAANLATEVYSEDGELLGTYYLENRSNCNYDELSEPLTEALLSTEDIRFYKHSGVDVKALFRVVFGVITGEHRGGGSTITQQLSKNLFHREPHINKLKLVLIKFKEWVVAVKLERKYSKDEIMAMYFNTVDFGNQAIGIKSAARTYFNKTPQEINIQEAALLVGMLKAPTQYNPRRHYQASLKRRNLVLQQMRKYNYLSKHDCDSVAALPIDLSQFRQQIHTAGKATYFREYLRKYLTKWCAENPKKDGSHYDLY